jgi:hypothetical protein
MAAVAALLRTLVPATKIANGSHAQGKLTACRVYNESLSPQSNAQSLFDYRTLNSRSRTNVTLAAPNSKLLGFGHAGTRQPLEAHLRRAAPSRKSGPIARPRSDVFLCAIDLA